MLKNKTVIITGGSRGIGAAIAHKFASLGANIAILYLGNQAAAEQVCEDCKSQYGVNANAYRCDVADFTAVKAVAAQICKDFSAVHILINNAGITRDSLIATMQEVDYDAVLDTNLKGAFNMIRHCTGMFIREKEGCIINITSVSGIMGNAGQANYSAAKAGMIGLTKSVAKELAPKNIRCNAIAPGFIATDMTDGQTGNPLIQRIPLGRIGTPEDVAEAAVFLAEAAYITGEVLRVDGGIAI